VLAPATLAALPSTRAIPNRDVFYVARIPAAPFALANIKNRRVVVWRGAEPQAVRGIHKRAEIRSDLKRER
jgi:hypothetical protein